ncbi:hypothetical protein B1748_18050 [Paenibacillus sp. MY03]|uniref:iron-sulfur cluster biosynthesis family protein n=1 Tax=Paenibacillus sp. MY03 TaxID=302980 RepID=UPI000B3BDE25|nr:iron-sulfur cluster biosynthesis family protein [Paenibacillus sp. MY03]OUS75376.1 hypothetical protein B1748_18050 [Paenibacillus sp. MY03]
MFITFSASAARKLEPYLADGSAKLKLLHDTDRGCGMSGVPTLRLIGEPTGNDRQASGDPFTFYYEPWQEVFYEDNLRVDYNETEGSFSLRGDSQIYTSHLRFIDRVM